MRAAVAVRKPVQTTALNTATTNLPTGSWTTLLAKVSNLKASSAMEIFNPSGSSVQIATGDAGSEVALPYTILPGGSNILLASEIPKGVRISLQPLDTAISQGYFILNQFG